jgi:hypothetical protein
MLDHVVLFYEPGPSNFVANIADFIAGALRGGDVAIAIAQAERLNALQRALHACGVDCREAVKRGRLELLDGHKTLARFMYGGRPDPEAFERVIGDKVREMLSRRHAGRLHAYGEMVGILWKDGNDAGAVELERLWNGLLEGMPAALYCGYPIEGFDQPVWTDTMEAVLAAHTRAIPEQLITRSA